MSPLLNAILGVAFLAAGAGATIVMYRLRGAPLPGPAGKPTSRPVPQPKAEPADYLATWSRSSDDREPLMATIHAMAATGKSVIEPMATGQRPVGWEALLFQGSQVARVPRNEDEPVRTETVLGPAARQPLVLSTPIYVSHMSYGALSPEVKVALAAGTAAVGTAIGSGEGGILEEEFAAALKYIFEYVPNLYSVTDDNLARVHAIEIKFGQSAKPGMGGHLPGNKVTAEIARVRNRPPGVDITSPARFPDLQTRAQLRQKIDWLRARSGGKPIGVKLAAGQVEADLEFVLDAGPDFVTLDGRPGATGAAPKVVKDATSIPTVFALARARRVLDAHGADHVSLVVTGGLRTSADVAKALALGADGVAVATAALMAAGCQQYRICHTGRCPVGITTQDPGLRQRFDVHQSAARVERYLRVCTEELKTFARLTGHADVHDLTVADLSTTDSEISNHTPIEHV